MSKFCFVSIAACFWIVCVPGQKAVADITGEYKIVEASRPGGGGNYGGKINITAQGPSFQFKWTLDSGDTYSGPAIMHNGVVGAGYGEGLSGLAVYAIKGKTLKARWLLPATPKDVGEYELSGPATLNGFYKFTNGLAGGVTIKPNGKVYDVSWNLPTGKVTGVGVKLGDVLVAVSGTAGSSFGVAAYRAGKDHIEGIWTVPGETNFGTENIVPASDAPAVPAAPATAAAGPAAKAGGAAAFAAGGNDVVFGGETYHLADSVSAPGQATSEVREYLRAGEDFDHYPKMVALRIQDAGKGDALALTRGILNQVTKEYPGTPTHELEHTSDSATMAFVLKVGPNVEFNFWHCFRTPLGIASVQFVLRNKPPLDSEDKVKAEATDHIDDYIRDAKALAPQVLNAISKTVKSNGAPASAKPAEPPATGRNGNKPAEMSNDDLADRIMADFDNATPTALKFLEFLKADKFDDAAALIADEGFTRMHTTRKDFAAKLQETRKTDGRLLSYAPDKSKPDFGPEPGGIYFVLAVNSKYEKTAAHDTMRFFRFTSDGKLKMVDFQHASNAKTGQ